MDELTMEQWEMGIYEAAIETWGRQAQMMKAAEELCELAAAINRLLCCEKSGYRSREDVLAELMGELADVEIMLNQLHYWVTEPDIPRLTTKKEHRVDRLRALGNAVYWRQFYPIFRGIMEIETWSTY